MKRILPYIAFAIFSFMCLSVSAQTSSQRQPLPLVKYDANVNAPLSTAERAMLEEVYGTALQSDILSNPRRLKDIKNILRNRVEIVEISNSRDHKPCPLLSEVPVFNAFVEDLQRDPVFNKNTFNPLKYTFPFYGRGTSLFRVDNTNYFIIIKSQHQR